MRVDDRFACARALNGHFAARLREIQVAFVGGVLLAAGVSGSELVHALLQGNHIVAAELLALITA